MNLRYQNLSLGYIGEANHQATINAQYYAELIQHIHYSDDLFATIHVFPQRIPRLDFFRELIWLETNQFENSFKHIIEQINLKYQCALQRLTTAYSEKNVRKYINWSNLMLRYCQFETLVHEHPILYSGPFTLEIKLIHEIAQSEIALSQGEAVCIQNALNLTEIYLSDPKTTLREKILLLNHIVVTHYRYCANNANQEKVYGLAQALSVYLNEIKDNNLVANLLLSIGYRGLAMVNEFGLTSQAALLKRSEILARTLHGDNKFEDLVIKDNLITCLQSVSKWHLQQSKIANAIANLKEIITIDNADSTGHSELGLVYFENKQFQHSAKHFKQAMLLGPPGAGMNAYYYALSLFELGLEDEAIVYLYHSTELDEQALSPWLDLIEYYLKKDMPKKAIPIAKKINSTSALLDQLNEAEIQFIQNLID